MYSQRNFILLILYLNLYLNLLNLTKCPYDNIEV